MNEQNDASVHAETRPWRTFEWLSGIPLCDDLWLSMQAQNIVVVDLIVRQFEHEALEAFYENDRFSVDTFIGLSLGYAILFGMLSRESLERILKGHGANLPKNADRRSERKARDKQKIRSPIDETEVQD
jgi:hypothetical protein